MLFSFFAIQLCINVPGMIVINSNQDDISTMMVAKWLRHFKKPFLILFEDTEITEVCYDLSGKAYFRLKDDRQFNFDEISSYWYRRGQYRFRRKQKKIDGSLPFLNKQTNRFLRDESLSFSRFVDYQLSCKRSINNLNSTAKVNKLILAVVARQVGFKIPETLVTSSKEELVAFVEMHKNVITKPIETILSYTMDNHWMPMYTEELTPAIINKLPPVFASSLFQKKIEKKYELRVFCLEREKYAMAIFSQRDRQTSVDFRNYNTDKPNRNVPFRLPSKYSDMIDEFMKISNFNSGSFDILVDNDNNYYFLEINPVGQFGMVSLPCNYYLEKKIAKFL